jgi:hypothetical protein
MSPSSSNPSDNVPIIGPSVPDIQVTIMKRPRYSVEVEETIHYCQNVDAIIKLLSEHDRVISTSDVFKALDMKPSYKYRLRERLNGAIIRKVARS